MGEIADMMIGGELCVSCGAYLGGKAHGVPRYCRYCTRPATTAWGKAPCPTCGRQVKTVGLLDHLRDAHGVKT